MKITRGIFFILALPVVTGIALAQTDSIRYQNMSVFEIRDGKKTASYFIKNQKTFTMDDLLIREIDFDDSTKHIQHYIFYFYRDGKLFTEEKHKANDSIQSIIRHKYFSNGLEKERAILERNKGKMKVTVKSTYTYDKAGQMIVMKENGPVKKSSCTTTYSYASGHLVKEESIAKNPADNIISRTTEYQYDQDGKLTIKSVSNRDKNGNGTTYTETYAYNDKGRVKKTEVRNAENMISVVKNYEYYANGNIRNYYEQDVNGATLLFHTFIIKNYKINLGNQKSYFDKH
jgi:hypothetical protein